MKIRIRNKWRNKNRNTSLEDNATALAYVIWQIALTATKNLHAEDFNYESDEQRIAVIAEYSIFLVHVGDRIARSQMNDDSRERFITTLAKQAARHYQRNVEDIIGKGDYLSGFLDKLNRRIDEYAETQFVEDEPGYETRRYLGDKIQDVMGSNQTNKWVMQQVVDLDAPEAVKHFKNAVGNIFGSANIDPREMAKDAVIGAD